MRSRFKKIFLLAGDVAFFYLGLYLALTLRYGQIPSGQLWQDHLPSFSFLLLIWILVFYISDLYDLSSIANTPKFIKLALKNFLTAVVISIIFFYITAVADNISPKTNLAVFAVIYLFLFLAWRKIFSWSLSSYIPKTNLAIIGASPETASLIREIKEKPHLGYKISFVFDPQRDKKEFEKIPVFNQAGKLRDLIRKKRINTVILNQNIKNFPEIRSTLFNCLPFKVSFVSLSDIFENITGRVPIDIINQTWFLENLSEGNKDWFDRIKRAYDFAFSLLLLILTSPLYPFIALIIKLESPGPVFFRQKRSGQHGRPFTMIKFRTMKTEANDHSPTQVQDKRITKFGSLLRKTRLDELPQTLNILKGEMSFVGPRPERPELIEKLEGQIPFYGERMLVKPGITGWDQISGEYHSPSYEDTLKKLQYDLFYIKNRSVYLDLSIALKTISTIISKAGR